MVDLNKLKELTYELAEEIQGNLHAGPLFGLLMSYFDTVNTYVSIIRNDKTVLYLNKAARERIEELGLDPDDYIDEVCVGLRDQCGLVNNCPLEECIETKKIVVRHNIKSPITDIRYTVVCMPLVYNGVSAVVEMWTEVQ